MCSRDLERYVEPTYKTAYQMEDPLAFGPYAAWKHVSVFNSLSQQVYRHCSQLFSNGEAAQLSAVHHLFVRFHRIGQSTSFAIRVLTSWGAFIPAVALARVRVEQLIVSSYLIHEQQEVGLKPFLQFMPIGHYHASTSAFSDPLIASLFDAEQVQSELHARAVAAQTELKPGFDATTDKFERKWTKLDLRSMAHRRDVLAAGKNRLSSLPLERQYLGLYKEASSAVHSDVDTLTPAFMDIYPVGVNGEPVLMANPKWADLVVSLNAAYDIIQAYEVLSYAGIECLDYFSQMLDDWVAARDRLAGQQGTSAG